MTYALKFLDSEGLSPHVGEAWSLPNGKPGRWKVAKGELEVCRSGIHAVKLNEGALDWLRPDCYVIELAGKVIYDEAERKYVARKGRLIRKVDGFGDRELRLFAADCAAHVLKFYEREYPQDKRPREAIKAARAFARTPSDRNRERMAAARDAARAAAWDAARAAAWDAARAAARDAARDAARRWQAHRLAHYIDAPEVER